MTRKHFSLSGFRLLKSLDIQRIIPGIWRKIPSESREPGAGVNCLTPAGDLGGSPLEPLKIAPEII